MLIFRQKQPPEGKDSAKRFRCKKSRVIDKIKARARYGAVEHITPRQRPPNRPISAVKTSRLTTGPRCTILRLGDAKTEQTLDRSSNVLQRIQVDHAQDGKSHLEEDPLVCELLQPRSMRESVRQGVRKVGALNSPFGRSLSDVDAFVLL